MSKNKLIYFGLISVISLFGCSSQSSNALYTVNGKDQIIQAGDLRIYFPKGNDIPYVSLEAGIAAASSYRSASYRKDSYGYSYSYADGVATATDEKGTKATFDANNQTITIDHFDSFMNGYFDGALPLSVGVVLPGMKSIKLIKEESAYTAGKALTMKLNDYPSIQLVKDGDNILIPFTPFSDIFFGNISGTLGLVYNFKDSYLAPNGLRSLTSASLNALGKKCFDEAPKKKTVSKEYAEYVYDAMMFNMDHFYGLKEFKKIDSFAKLTIEKGLKDDMLSGDVEKMENAYFTMLLKHLEDGHTAYLTPPVLSDYDEFELDVSCYSKKEIAKQQENETMDNLRKSLKVDKPFEIIGDTAFIYFDNFVGLDDEILYGGNLEEHIASNNAALFAYSYKQIKANKAVKNVVVDLVTNNGGDADGLVYCLGTLLGKYYIDAENPLTGSRNHSTFMTDINIDGVIDEKDVPLCNDYNIYMLDSKFAFSCGNLFPVAAKYNNSNVKILGDRTGGGTCVISTSFNGIGSSFTKSSALMLTKKVDGEYKNIEDGAEVDTVIDYDKMLDRNYIVKLINNA